MKKTIDLKDSVYQIVQAYPEIKEAMVELGFSEITKPIMLHSIGKKMTIPKGAALKKVPLAQIVTAFQTLGFEVLNGPAEAEGLPLETSAVGNDDERVTRLKGYLRRLGDGEDLATVQEDFPSQFGHVAAQEIMSAEQALLDEGVPSGEIQKLCDLHSALFHGATAEEKALAEAGQAVHTVVDRRAATAAEVLMAVPGHPLATFRDENRAIAELIAGLRKRLEEPLEAAKGLARFDILSRHYAKKGDLLYPLLKVNYDLSGPSEVMWSVDDEIRAEIRQLVKADPTGAGWQARLAALLTRAEEMIYKEANILFPLCASTFTEAEWMAIYRDSKAYGENEALGTALWPAAEETPREASLSEGTIVLPGGHLQPEQLAAMMRTLPVEITFVDAGNVNRYFNEGPKLFQRPSMAIDRDVFACHPPKIVPMVERIIESFRDGSADRYPIWMEKEGRPVRVTYMAVRDTEGDYLGTMELVEDMSKAAAHFARR